jgi:hypothetical protein
MKHPFCLCIWFICWWMFIDAYGWIFIFIFTQFPCVFRHRLGPKTNNFHSPHWHKQATCLVASDHRCWSRERTEYSQVHPRREQFLELDSIRQLSDIWTDMNGKLNHIWTDMNGWHQLNDIWMDQSSKLTGIGTAQSWNQLIWKNLWPSCHDESAENVKGWLFF